MSATIITNLYAEQDMADPGSWYGGFKEARVVHFGDAERVASHPWTGDWAGSTFDVSLADYDQSIRQRLASAIDRFWTAPLTVRLTSRDNRAALGPAYGVFSGPIIGVQPTSPLGFDLTLGDIVSQGLLSDQNQVPWRVIGDAFLADLTAQSDGLDLKTPEPIFYGIHSRVPDVDPPSPQGFVYTPTYLGLENVGGTPMHVWLVAGHACKNLPDLFVDGVSVIAAEGTDWLVPHHAGWTAQFTDPYRDRASATYAVDRRYTLIYGVQGNANPDACALAEKVLTVSIEGIEDVGDGSGDLITDRLQQYKHFLINFVANRGPNSYQAGAWLPNPTWALFDGAVQIVDEASFDAATAIGILRLPSDGYIGAAVIGANAQGRTSVTRVLSDWNRSCAVQLGVTHDGQLRVFMLHPTDAIKAAATLYTDATEILQGSFGTDVRWADLANRVPYEADYEHASGQWKTYGSFAWDPAIVEYGREILGEVRQYPFAPGVTMAEHLARLEALVRKDPPRMVSLTATIGPDAAADSLGYRDFGDYIRYRHFAAVGAAAQIRLAQVQRIVVQVGARSVLVEALDCDDLIGYDDVPST